MSRFPSSACGPPDLVVDGTNTVPYLPRCVRGERIVRTVGAGLVPALGTHKGCPYVVADYVSVFRKRTTKHEVVIYELRRGVLGRDSATTKQTDATVWKCPKAS